MRASATPLVLSLVTLSSSALAQTYSCPKGTGGPDLVYACFPPTLPDDPLAMIQSIIRDFVRKLAPQISIPEDSRALIVGGAGPLIELQDRGHADCVQVSLLS